MSAYPTEGPFPDWRTDDAAVELVHPANSIAQADVYMARQGDRALLIKTFENKCLPIRRSWGYWVLGREARILRHLLGIRGVPHLIGFDPRGTLFTEFIEGSHPLRDSRELAPGEYPPLSFFAELRELLAEIHGRGVAHGDIRRRNILVDSEGRPHIIDFATAIAPGASGWFPRWPVFGAFVRADLFSILKIQYSYYPDSLDEQDRKYLFDRPWYVSLGRFLRKRIYRNIVKQKHWKERWQRWRQAFGCGSAMTPSGTDSQGSQ